MGAAGVLWAGLLLVWGAGPAQAVTGLDGQWYPEYQRPVVRWAQQALKAAGGYAGPANGRLDGATMDALKTFQGRAGLNPSGVPTPLTRRALRSAAPAVKAPPEAIYDGVAMVAARTGEVRLTHPAETARRVRRDFQHRLRMDDVLETGPNGKAMIQFDDGSALILGNNTKVQVRDFVVAPAERERSLLVQATQGVLRFVARAAADATDDVRVQAPTAFAAVRGTDWMMQISSDRTAVFVEGGRVAVTNIGPNVKQVVLEKGQGTDVEAGKQPTDPAAWGPQRIRALFKAIEYP
jgi:hypothetical protein